VSAPGWCDPAMKDPMQAQRANAADPDLEVLAAHLERFPVALNQGDSQALFPRRVWRN
jgi:hypothetical protein